MANSSKFEILPHTADIRIKATGATRAGLLIAALKGMFAAAAPRWVEENGELVDRKFDVTSPDFSALLVDALNEAVSLSDTNKEAYEDIKLSLITDKRAQGSFIGRAVTGFETQIKAATHHDLEVKKNEQGQWEATMVFDA